MTESDSRFVAGGSRAGVGSPAPGGPDYTEIRAALIRSVRRVCPPWLANQAEDIVQAAMMRVLEMQRRPEHEGVLQASYLWRVAYSVTVDEIRRCRRRRETGLDEAIPPEGGPEAGAGAEEARSLADLKAAVRDCLGTMNPARRAVVELHLLGDELGEIEMVTRWAPKKVRNLLYRGLANLRHCLRAKGVNG